MIISFCVPRFVKYLGYVCIDLFFFSLVNNPLKILFFSFKPQGFITDHERALEELFGENVENSRKFDSCLNTMAVRIATVFASLKVSGYACVCSHELNICSVNVSNWSISRECQTTVNLLWSYSLGVQYLLGQVDPYINFM